MIEKTEGNKHGNAKKAGKYNVGYRQCASPVSTRNR